MKNAIKKNEILINDLYTRSVISLQKDDVEKINLEPRELRSCIKTELFLERLQESLPLDTGIIPKNCRYNLKFQNGCELLVIEDEPRIRTIKFKSDLNHLIERHRLNGKFEKYNLETIKLKETNLFSLSFPYIVYFIIFDNFNLLGLHVFFRVQPITSLSDYLLEPCLSNIDDENYQVCLGSINQVSSNENKSLAVDYIINNFWSSSFNFDYSGSLYRYENNPELCDFFTWQYYSKVDPLFIFSTKWNVATVCYEDSSSVLNIKKFINHLYDTRFSKSSFSDYTRRFFSLLKSIDSDEKTTNDNLLKFESRLMSDSFYLKEHKSIISVGDSFIIDNKTFYINSFIFNGHNGSIESLTIEDDNGHIKEINIKDDFFKLICDQYKNKESVSVVINNINYKKGDLILNKHNNSISFINKIERTRDGLFHFKIGNTYYLESSFLNGIEKIENIENIFELDGIKLKKNEKYFISEHNFSSSIFIDLHELIFNGYSIVDDQLVLDFNRVNEPIDLGKETNSNNKFQIQYEKSELSYYKIISEENINSPNFFRVNNKIFINKSISNIKCFLLKDNGIGIDSYSKRDLSIGNKYFQYNKSEFLSYLNLNNSLNIQSFDFDINLNVGDEIVYIDWTTPNEMTIIRTIKSFYINEESNYLMILTEDDNKNELNIKYINLENGLINSESVRKVCRQLNNLKVGMVVSASKTGIADFPKKDCNEIKAFVIDEKTPLILFSNYRTLYIDQFEGNFNILDNNKKISEIKNDIKFQPGDLLLRQPSLNDNKIISIVLNDSYFQYDYCYDIRYPNFGSIEINFGLSSSYCFKNTELIRYGLLYPRYSNQRIEKFNNVRRFPLFRNKIINQNTSNSGSIDLKDYDR